MLRCKYALWQVRQQQHTGNTLWQRSTRSSQHPDAGRSPASTGVTLKHHAQRRWQDKATTLSTAHCLAPLPALPREAASIRSPALRLTPQHGMYTTLSGAPPHNCNNFSQQPAVLPREAVTVMASDGHPSGSQPKQMNTQSLRRHGITCIQQKPSPCTDRSYAKNNANPAKPTQQATSYHCQGRLRAATAPTKLLLLQASLHAAIST